MKKLKFNSGLNKIENKNNRIGKLVTAVIFIVAIELFINNNLQKQASNKEEIEVIATITNVVKDINLKINN